MLAIKYQGQFKKDYKPVLTATFSEWLIQMLASIWAIISALLLSPVF